MAEHQLHRAQVSAAGEQMAGEGMAQDVGRDAAGLEARLGRQLAQQLREPLSGEVALAGPRGKQEGAAATWPQECGPDHEVGLQRLAGRPAHRHETLLAALAPDHQEATVCG
jgi:hypothetical protein